MENLAPRRIQCRRLLSRAIISVSGSPVWLHPFNRRWRPCRLCEIYFRNFICNQCYLYICNLHNTNKIIDLALLYKRLRGTKKLAFPVRKHVYLQQHFGPEKVLLEREYRYLIQQGPNSFISPNSPIKVKLFICLAPHLLRFAYLTLSTFIIDWRNFVPKSSHYSPIKWSNWNILSVFSKFATHCPWWWCQYSSYCCTI